MQGSGSKGGAVLYNTWLFGLDWRGKGMLGEFGRGREGRGPRGKGPGGDVM